MGRGFQRTARKRALRTTILVVCGGKTEVNYFSAFPVDTKVVFVKITGHGIDPKKLVKRAISERDNIVKTGTPYNQIWCVFDKDAFTDCDFNNAVKTATESGINVAYSNQCFELWYCLHYSRIDIPLHRNQYAEKLDKIWGKYVKTDTEHYALLKKKQKNAVKFAKELYSLKARRSPAKQDPVTLVYKLVETLNKYL
ncbi:RloB domain-containing protein [candidate division KSB1 bacterium]|nr:RloB domain-containing protein [candidate division KSB1 bacterium]